AKPSRRGPGRGPASASRGSAPPPAGAAARVAGGAARPRAWFLARSAGLDQPLVLRRRGGRQRRDLPQFALPDRRDAPRPRRGANRRRSRERPRAVPPEPAGGNPGQEPRRSEDDSRPGDGRRDSGPGREPDPVSDPHQDMSRRNAELALTILALVL